MKAKLLTVVFAVSLLWQIQPNLLSAGDIKASGLGMRWAFWDMGNNSTFFTYIEEDGREYLETGGFGGWLFFTSRASDYWLMEVALGAFGQVDGESYFWEDNYDATAVVPVVLGVQREFLSAYNTAALRPYVCFGGGPYWITDVVEEDRFNRQEVHSKIKPGAYLGGGVRFFLGETFAINFDTRYHLVDLNPDHDLSGLEIGLGFGIHWGSYRRDDR
jgi:hypothetical protein